MSAPARPVETLPASARTEIMISWILRAGVIASLALVVAGTGLSFARHPDYFASPAAFASLRDLHASFPTTIGGVASGLARLQGRAFVMAGLLLLIATPVLRVAVSVVAFAQERDKAFVVLTSIVLALLLLSLALGRAGG